jgi:hypothetical protein
MPNVARLFGLWARDAGVRGEKKDPRKEMDQPYFIPLYLLTVFFFFFFFFCYWWERNNSEAGELLVCVSARQNWSKSPNPVRMTTAL